MPVFQFVDYRICKKLKFRLLHDKEGVLSQHSGICRLSVIIDFPVVCTQQTGDYFPQSGFSASVRANQPHHFSGMYSHETMP